MSDFLTLGISEKRPNVPDEFVVVAMDLRTKDITRFDVDKSDIISANGEVFWDIGFVTHVDNITRPSKYKQVPIGASLGENRIKDLKRILESKSVNPSDFFNSERLEYSIVKVINVEDIETKDNSKFYLRVNIEGLNRNPKKILNKDFRWVKYWRYICKSSKFDEKKKQYMKLLNNKRKNLYLILYRHSYPNNKFHWIIGMHFL